MKIEHLYVIGNGFDLHHGIKSKYIDYRDWLERNGEYDAIDAIDRTFGPCDDEWWKNFEQKLGMANMLEIAIEEAIQNSPNFASDNFRDADWYDAENAVDLRLTKAYFIIRESLQRWANQLNGGEASKKVRLADGNRVFLNFNYSDTLESLYHIPQESIFYIHGKASNGDDLILGHGIPQEQLEGKVKETIKDNDDENDSAFNFITQRAKDAAVSNVYAQRKMVEKIIANNELWFAGLHSVRYIHFWGHSFGEVDLPYFRKILESVDKGRVEIEVSYYEEADKKAIAAFMKSEGIMVGKGIGLYHTMKLSEILLNTENKKND